LKPAFQDPSLVEAMNGANKVRSYDIPPSSLERKFGAAPAAKPAARAAPKPAAKPAARAAPKPAARAAPPTGRPGSVRK
jgi:hypothetical protein